jgi:hypothetical protein
MKRFFIGIVALLLFACNSQNVDNTITIVNTSDKNCTDKAVAIKKEKLEKLVANAKVGFYPLLKDTDGKVIPTQFDDLDKDGEWDELFLLIDLKPNEEKTLTVTFVEKEDLPKFAARTNIRFADMTEQHNELTSAERLKSTDSPTTQKYFTMEGPAWENEYVAFRNYFDARNAFDIFGKRVTKMVLDSVGLTPHSYHHLASWGMDVLKVGNSLGAGALVIKKGDKFFRFTNPETGEATFDKGTVEVIADGPLRSIIKLGIIGWNVDGNICNFTHEISIWGGTHFYKSKVTISGLKGDESLVTGIVNKQSDSLMVFNPNSKLTCLATHDNQAYDGEKMGLAIVLHKNELIKTIEAPETGEGIVQTYMAEMKIENEKPVEFYFFTGWELQNEKFKDTNYFIDMIKAESQRLLAETIQVK